MKWALKEEYVLLCREESGDFGMREFYESNDKAVWLLLSLSARSEIKVGKLFL